MHSAQTKSINEMWNISYEIWLIIVLLFVPEWVKESNSSFMCIPFDKTGDTLHTGGIVMIGWKAFWRDETSSRHIPFLLSHFDVRLVFFFYYFIVAWFNFFCCYFPRGFVTLYHPNWIFCVLSPAYGETIPSAAHTKYEMKWNPSAMLYVQCAPVHNLITGNLSTWEQTARAKKKAQLEITNHVNIN